MTRAVYYAATSGRFSLNVEVYFYTIYAKKKYIAYNRGRRREEGVDGGEYEGVSGRK